MKSYSNILIITHKNIGDILHNMAVLKPLKKAFPNAILSLLTSSIGKNILTHNAYISHILLHTQGSSWKKIWERFQLIRLLRKKKYDLIINLKMGSYFAYFLGAKSVWSVPKKFKTRNRKRNTHLIDTCLHVLKFQGLEIQRGDLDLRIQTTTDEKREIETLLLQSGIQEADKIVVISPFANWHAKEWPLQRFQHLATDLSHFSNIKTIFIGGKEDQKKIIHEKNLFLNWIGKLSLRQVAALYEKTTLAIGIDSGPFHMAANMNIPVIGIFGATTTNRAFPYFSRDHVVECTVYLGCNPCSPAGDFMACRVYDKPTPCMEAIPYETVYNKVVSILRPIRGSDHPS